MTDTRQNETAEPMEAVDHTPPVEGTQRVFKRDNEGQQAMADGGQSRHDGGAGNGTDESEDADDETEDTDTERFKARIKEVDHTPPVEGAKRTFERDSEERETERQNE